MSCRKKGEAKIVLYFVLLCFILRVLHFFYSGLYFVAKSRCSQLLAQIPILCESFTRRCNAIIMKMPTAVRQLTVGEFCNVYGGSIKTFNEKTVERTIQNYKPPESARKR